MPSPMPPSELEEDDSNSQLSEESVVSGATPSGASLLNTLQQAFFNCLDTSNLKLTSKLKAAFIVNTDGYEYFCLNCVQKSKTIITRSDRVKIKKLKNQEAGRHLASHACRGRKKKDSGKTENIFVFHKGADGLLVIPEMFEKKGGLFNSIQFNDMICSGKESSDEQDDLNKSTHKSPDHSKQIDPNCILESSLDSNQVTNAESALKSTSGSETEKPDGLHQDCRLNLSHEDFLFDYKDLLGYGSFGVVHTVKFKHNESEIFAIKTVTKPRDFDMSKDSLLRREVENWWSLNHDNIAQMYGFYEERDNICLVMELAHCSLANLIEKRGRFMGYRSAVFFKQICKALQFCHSKKIVHRDVKSSNILVAHDRTLKLADFGASSFCGADKLQTQIGTEQYMAPEILSGKAYDCAVDLWSAGAVLFELLTAVTPFAEGPVSQRYKRINKAVYKVPEYVSDKAIHLISQLLLVDARSRFTATQALEHEFMVNVVEHQTTTFQKLSRQRVLNRKD